MAWALVGSIAQQENTATAASLQVNLAQTATAGNTILVVAIANRGVTPTMTCTDSAGNTYTERITKTDTSAFNRISIFESRNITGAPTWVKITPDASSFLTLEVGEYSGLDNAATPQTTSGGPTNSTTATAGSLTPTNANSLCLMGMTHQGVASQSLTADTGNGYTERGHIVSTAGMPIESQDASKSGATNPSVVLGATAQWIAVMAVYKPAAATAKSPPPYFKPLRVWTRNA